MSKRLIAMMIVAPFLVSCTSWWVVDSGHKRTCKVQCKVFASDGERCVEWADDATEICTGGHVPAYACCTQGGRCPLEDEVQAGSACYCDFYTPYGAQRLPGAACR